jgi:hypothetical protein
MNPASNPAAAGRDPLDERDDDPDDERAEELARAVSLVEDWLLHASDAALDELADFAYGPDPTRHGRHCLRWIIDRLGDAAARLRPSPAPAPPEPTIPPTIALRGGSR